MLLVSRVVPFPLCFFSDSWLFHGFSSFFFPEIVELGKQISCSLQLSNKTDDYVAFKSTDWTTLLFQSNFPLDNTALMEKEAKLKAARYTFNKIYLHASCRRCFRITAKCLVPIIQKLRHEELEGIGNSSSQAPRVVILAPTAELASQKRSRARKKEYIFEMERQAKYLEVYTRLYLFLSNFLVLILHFKKLDMVIM
ncbi:hypothetical protein K1719_002640 [Acacia pycnantha]|nr:hypothetical protein K1719_002640 [Acacia pycnantha]